MVRAWGRTALPPLLILCLLHLQYSPLVFAQEGQEKDPATLFARASEMMNLRKYDGALGLLNAVLEVDPSHSEAYRQRASVLRHKCRYKEAESDYNKYLELNPRTATVEKELSQLLQAQNSLQSAYGQFDFGDFSKVLEYINKIVLVFSPGCLKAKLLKAKALLALKDYSSVISETGFVLKEDEDNLDALLLRGRAYYYLADHDVASRHYQKGLRLDPEHSDLKKAYFGLKNLLKKTKSAEDNAAKGKLRLSAEDYKTALAMDPEHTAYNRGEAKLLSEDWEGAVQDLKEAAQKSPQDMGIREALMRAEKQLKLSKRKDWYKFLGISKTASAAEIKRAYKKLALQWHPDKNVDNREEAENMFREIAAAYEVLGDEDKRVRYDRGEDVDEMNMGGGGGGFNPFGGGGQQYTFHFDGGFPGGGFPGGGGFQFNFG
ncbi:hypothetical protein PVAP13_5KG781800 [Panicum virgatum]|uniref:J domain-containing protein n=1 Tax=Panicum virgatum TaxID=38727 RepID=A0A8T0T5F3_PANVG|nr:hypothetical protein PVAP13_5KG781800 [Panicum virgatum]